MVELLTVAQAQAILSHYLEGEAEVSRIERIRSEDIIRFALYTTASPTVKLTLHL